MSLTDRHRYAVPKIYNFNNIMYILYGTTVARKKKMRKQKMIEVKCRLEVSKTPAIAIHIKIITAIAR